MQCSVCVCAMLDTDKMILDCVCVHTIKGIIETTGEVLNKICKLVNSIN